MVRRSTFVICESQSQVKLIVSKFKNRNELNCLAFPGRLIDVRPRRDKDYNFIDSRFKLKVGVLGSLDDKKRDYESLLQALVKIEKDSRPTLYFLGSRIPSGSEIILQKFREVTKIYYSSEKRVSETDFYKLGENCDVLIAPLSLNFNYGANFGTGSVADGIALKKFILFPKSIEIDDTLEYLFIRYGNSEELQTLLSKEANEFLISESTYEWSVINMRKKLKLI